MRTAFVFLLVVACALGAVAEQDAGGAGSGTQTGASAPAASTKPDRTVTLDVVVTDKAGKPVAGLQEQDFTVLDDKLAQKLRSFHAVAASTSPAPVEIILFVDSVNATFQTVASARQEIAKFLGQGGGKLAQPVAMGFFSNAGIKLQSAPTRDGQAVLAFFDENANGLRTITQSGGFYGGIERQQLSLRALALLAETEEKMPGRKLLVWISPGWPLFSGPGLDLTLKQRQGIFQSIVGLSALLRQADITMYQVDPLRAAGAAGAGSYHYRDFLKGVKAAKNAEEDNLALQVMVEQSGGKVLNSSNDLAGEINDCIADTDAYYVLSFDSAPPDGPVQYHAVEVKIGKSGLVARTRMGYYEQQ